MNVEKLKQAIDYNDVYFQIAGGIEDLAGLETALKERGTNPSALQRRKKWLSEEPAYLKIEDGLISFDVKALADDLDDLRGSVIPELFDRAMDNEVTKTMASLVSKNEKLTEENEMYKKELDEAKAYIASIEKELKEKKEAILKAELDRKVIVSSSIKIGPIERDIDEIYLTDPTHYCDIEKCVAKYGGILDSFYQEIPDDKQEENSFEQGHDLTLKNYLLKVMKTVGTERFFKKRIKDNAEAKKIEEKVGKIMPGHDTKKKEWEAARDRILRNRYISINKIIAATDLSNQEKLMLYAMNSMYHNTDVERLLLYASQHCINADLLIYLMEDPEVCTTYENTIDFLDMFVKPSEFKMKYEFAKELISGKWYISADYNGKNTKFQLVPIDEFNELREKAGLPKSKFGYKEEKALPQNDEKPTVECAEDPEVTEGMEDAEDQGGNDT